MVKLTDEKPIQAVVIADNFDSRFSPLGLTWACLPLAGAPLLDLTLESLSRTEIKDVIITVSSENAAKFELLLKPWRPRFDSLKVVQCRDCNSVGDALREVHKRHVAAGNALLTGDFLLLQVGAVFATSLRHQFAGHRARREKDKKCILSALYTSASGRHPARASAALTRLTLATHSATRRLVFYQETPATIGSRRRLNLPKDLLSRNDIQIRSDLNDCQLAICSAQIPTLFYDNFDFQTRHDIIREILTNEEVHGLLAHIEVLPEADFAAFVSDFDIFRTVGQCMLKRWSYPLVPDMLGLDADYRCKFRHVYQPTNSELVATISKSAKITSSTLIGPKCCVGENSCISGSILGAGCRIGSNCSISGCVLLDGVIVGNGVSVQDSFICAGASIGANSTVAKQCVVGPRVHLAANASVETGSVLCKDAPNPDDDSLTAQPYGSSGCLQWSLGGRTDGFWPELRWETDEMGGEVAVCKSEGLGEASGVDAAVAAVAAVAAASSARTLSAVDSEDEEDVQNFFVEVYESIERGLKEDLSPENLILEVNSSKFAYNVTMDELNSAVIRSLLEIARHSGENIAFLDRLKEIFAKLKKFLANYFNNSDSQLNALGAIEDFVVKHESHLDWTMKLIHYLYDEIDFLSEENILSWHENLEDDAAILIKPKVAAFINWLEEAEEDSSD